MHSEPFSAKNVDVLALFCIFSAFPTIENDGELFGGFGKFSYLCHIKGIVRPCAR